MEIVVTLEFLAVILLVVLGCLFPNLLIDAMKAPEEQAGEKRYRVGACFGGILFLLVWILN